MVKLARFSFFVRIPTFSLHDIHMFFTIFHHCCHSILVYPSVRRAPFALVMLAHVEVEMFVVKDGFAAGSRFFRVCWGLTFTSARVFFSHSLRWSGLSAEGHEWPH